MRAHLNSLLRVLLPLAATLCLPSVALAADNTDLTGPVKVLVLTTALAFIPALLLSLTSFTRILIVFSFLKQGLGTPHVPPSPVLVLLALLLTVFTSKPLLQPLYVDVAQPFQAGEINGNQALQRMEPPLRAYLGRRVLESDVALFAEIRGDKGYASVDEVPLSVLAPAFMLGELRRAFRMGFSLLLPFIVIDMLVAAVLMTLGMMMLPPVLVSLPLKVLVFVSIDGWSLLVESLARSSMG